MNAFDRTSDDAAEIIDEVQSVVNSYLAGERGDYNSVDDIIYDYLGLSGSYSWIFILDEFCYEV